MNTATAHHDVAARIANRLAETVGQQKYNMWFDRSARFQYNDQDRCLHVAVPNRFVADWIDRHFHQNLEQVARETCGEGVSLNLQVQPDHFANEPVPPANQPQPGTDASAARSVSFPTQRQVNTAQPGAARVAPATSRNSMVGITGIGQLRYNLQDFVVGPSNAMAFAAAQRLAEEQVDLGGPLFVHGGCGLGKTHLLQGICQRLLERRPEASVLYTTGEQFTNAFIAAVRDNKLEPFRRQLRRLDLLVVDDVHFIANKEKTQLEFLHSFDQIELAGARVVLASDSHPKLIKQFSEALVSRCIRGLVVQVTRPDLETRIRLVHALAERRGMVLTDAACRLLASQGDTSVRELQGMLTKLEALVVLMGKHQHGDAVGMAAVHQLLAEQTGVQPLRPIKFETVLEVVCDQLHVEPKKVLGPGRHRHLVLARSLAIYLARQLTSLSYPEIADAMGRSNHSTIITACQRMEKQLKANKPLLLPGRTEQTTPTELAEQVRRQVVQGTG